MASSELRFGGSEVAAVMNSDRAADASLSKTGPSVGLDEDDFHRVFLSFGTQWEPFSPFPDCLDYYY